MGALAIVGLVGSLAGTAASISEQGKTRSAQKKRNEKVSAQNAAAEATARRKGLREERVRRAQLMAEAELTGAAGSSTAISGAGLSGLLASEQSSAIGSGQAAAESFSASNQAIASSQARQQLFGNVASIGSSVFQSAGGLGAFDTPPKP